MTDTGITDGSRFHGGIRWLELNYGREFLPQVGLRDPLLKHRPWRRRRLERLGR